MIKLTDYTEISAFNESTSIVRRDKNIYIKKAVPRELSGIYKTLQNSRNKNVADIIAVYEYADAAVIIEEYVNGKTLADILKEEGTLSEIRTKHIIGQICDGLYFLHKLNIIHRDINPNNIMVSCGDAVKIIDFDISRNAKKNAKTDTVILGTVGYAAPEQFGFSQSDERTDVYAVGVLANVMLTGRLPGELTFGGRTGRVIGKAVKIDSKARYKSIISFKHAFSGTPDENTPLPLKILRAVPGFRTLVWWKMLLALLFYGIYAPLAVVFLSWSTSLSMALVTLIAEFFMFALPLILMTNVCGIRGKLSRNPFFAFATATAVSAVSFVAGVCIFLANTANI